MEASSECRNRQEIRFTANKICQKCEGTGRTSRIEMVQGIIGMHPETFIYWCYCVEPKPVER